MKWCILFLFCSVVLSRINDEGRSYGIFVINAADYERGLLKRDSYNGDSFGKIVVSLDIGMEEWTRTHPLLHGASIGRLENKLNEDGDGIPIVIQKVSYIGSDIIVASKYVDGNLEKYPYDGAVIGKMIVMLDPGMDEWTLDHPHLRGATIGNLVNQYRIYF